MNTAAFVRVAFCLCGVAAFSLVGENFGPYEARISRVQACRGAKSANSSALVVRLNDDGTIFTNATQYVDVVDPIAELRISYWTGVRYEQITKFRVPTLCRFSLVKTYALDPILKVDIVDGKCTIRKGSFSQPSIDIVAIARSVLSKNFFYGKIKARFYMYNKKYNVACVEYEGTSSKKTPT